MIIWLTEKKGYSPATRALLGGLLTKNGLPAGNIIYYSLHSKVPALGEYVKKMKLPTEKDIAAARHTLAAQVEGLKPNLIVVNDEPTLRVITQQPYTLATTRGSVYSFAGVPCIVLDDLQRMQYDPVSKFVLQLDLAKLVRYGLGKVNRRPPFQYHLCKTVEEVAVHCEAAKLATFVAVDTETHAKFITVLSYTYDKAGMLVTFAIPLFDPTVADTAAYWTEPDEFSVRKLLCDLNAHPVVKAAQNGQYDCAYFLKEQMPLVNYYLDSQDMMHSIWIEAPKRLHELASYWVDVYTYWKDDNKGTKEEGRFVLSTKAEMEKYWRYCGLDTYYTWLVCEALLKKLVQNKWSIDNYGMEFALSVGPCLEASMHGILVDEHAHGVLMEDQVKRSIAGMADMKALTGEPEFNNTSPKDVAWFLYDFCLQEPTRLQWKDPAKKGRKKYGPRSTDEKVLKIMKEQNNGLSCIARNFIDRLLKSKKPKNVLSNFQELNFLTMRGRFCYGLNASGTDTFRFSSSSNQFWIGRNVQNIAEWLREFLVANPDWVLCSGDYSASDDRFIAYESEDPDKMALVESGKDPHCFHASVFFSKDYNELFKGWKAKLPWVVNSTTGVRQNTKRVTHGRNFRMGAVTMYNTMGRDAVIATAIALGFHKAASFTDKELIGICQILCDKYDHPRTGLYKRLRTWADEITAECVANGRKMTNCFGLTRWFLGDVKDDYQTQMDLSSCYGQMGTAGNINRALKSAYYSGLYDSKFIFLQQGHDSLLSLCHKSVLHTKVPALVAVMEEKFVIHGRAIRIPVDMKVGHRWSEDMLPYSPDVTYEQIMAYDAEKFGKKFPKRTKAEMLEHFANMRFDEAGTPDVVEQPEGFEPQDFEEVDSLEPVD